MQSILSVILAVLLTLGSSTGLGELREAVSISARPRQVMKEVTNAPSKNPAAVTTTTEGVDWEDMEYFHYDPEKFYEMTDQLAELAKGNDAQAVLDLYDTLYDEYVRIDALDCIAYIHYSEDVTDEYWSAENIYCDTLVAETGDALATACHAVVGGHCARAFANHVGSDVAGAFRTYVPMTDREAEIVARQAELIDQYHEAMNDAGSASYTFRGEEWDWEMITGYQGEVLAYKDYEGYVEVYQGIQGVLNARVGPIFTELVSLRAEIAEIEGYDTFSALAYEQTYGRDYTPEDAQKLCDQVKAFAPAYYRELYYSDLWYENDSVSPVLSSEELVATLGEYAAKLDPMLTEPWQYMVDHGLYNIGVGDSRIGGAYTISIDLYKSPFIFADMYENSYDLSTVSHEFGHFTDSYYNAAPNILVSGGSYDLFEIHSTGLEALFTEFYNDVYDDGGDAARFINLGSMLESVIDGCIQDEFQRRIYEDPDMSLAEINKLYASICSSYGKYIPNNIDYSWIYISHTFESPLYYISYAASALAAIQIWDLAQEDFQSGVDAWKDVLEHGAYENGYMTVLPECGLRLFTEDDAIEAICDPLLRELSRLDNEYRA